MQLFHAPVSRHIVYGGGYRLLVLRAPDIAERALPGQFLHVRIPSLHFSSLRRPFSICFVEDGCVQILYKPVGRGTDALAAVAEGESLSVIGPLGNGFPLEIGERLPVLVGGGYGVAPLLFLASRLERAGVVFAGGRSREDLLLREEFAALGWEYAAATEDGTLGCKGFVTDAMDARLGEAERADCVIYACGPDGMLQAVSERAIEWNAPGWLSMDKHMGCGIGACLACVQTLRDDDGEERIARVCRDGPVFEAREIVWGKP